MRSSSITFWKTGVSRIPSRIHNPTPTMTMLIRNGMRQPHTRNWSPRKPAEDQHGQISQEEPGRRPELRPGGDKAAMLVGSRPFHRQKHRTSPFAADPDALDQANAGQ